MADASFPTLERAIYDLERELAELQSAEANESTAETLRLSSTLLGCLRRLTRGRALAEIQDAFGAPGDLGYETSIGDALDRTYRGGR